MKAPLLHIGHDVSKLKATLPDVTRAIIAILNTSAGDEVKKAALGALSQQFTIQNVSISSCNFQGK